MKKLLASLLLGFFSLLTTTATTVVWTNTAGGNWNVTANWSPNQLPTVADDVFITNNGTYAITLNVGSTNRTLTVGGSSGTQSVTNTAQTLTVPGTVLFTPNGRLVVSGGTISSSNTFTMNGTFLWNGGSFNGTNALVLNTPTAVAGAGTKTLSGKTLVNNSTITHSLGIFSTTGGATISNTPAGIFDVASDVGVTAAAGVRFFNAGLIRKSAGVGTSVLAPILNTTGTVEVQTGTLQLDGSTVTNAGSCTVAAGATLVVSPTSGTFLAGSTVSGAGNFTMSGSGTLEMLGSISISGTNTVTAGGTTVNFSGSTYSLNGGTLTTSSAITVNFNGTGTAAPAVVNMAGNIGGSNNITISGLFTWTGGNLIGSGSVKANGGIYYPVGTARGLNGRTLINNTTMTWEGGTFNMNGGAIFSNAPAATVNLTTGVNLASANPADLILNAGTFRKTSDDLLTKSIAGKFINVGTVEIQGGGLTFTGSATNTGNYLVSAGATLELSGNPIAMAAGSSISGAGNFSVVNGTSDLAGSLNVSGTNSVSLGSANFSGSGYTISGSTLNILSGNANFNGSGTVAPAVLNLSGGNLGGTNTVTVSGMFTWSGGNIIGSNSVTANGGLSYTGVTVRSLTGRTLINTATATWDTQNINFAGGGVISNAPTGTWNIEVDATIGGSGSVANAGLLRKTVGSLTTINVPLVNSGTLQSLSGVISFGVASIYTQTEGLTLLDGGNLANVNPLRINGGTLAGKGTVTGSVTNSGIVSPGTSPGQLIIGGNYVQTAAGTITVELAGTPASSSYDRLVVSNSMTLAGALNVTLTNSYYPAPDLVFTNVLRAASRSGTVGTFNFPSSAAGFQINYGSTNVNLEIINTVPNLPAISDQTVDELNTLNFNVNATDGDAPAQTLAYALANSPTNASINSSGQLTWQPTEAQGPFTTNITIVVTDNGTPNLTTNVTFQIVVREINVTPVLTLPANTSINEQSAYSANATATDSDMPTNSLTFALVAGPAGLTVSPAGAIIWTPLESQGSNSYPVSISVTDTNPVAFNTTSLSVTNSYQIAVNEVNLPPVLTPPSNQTITEENSLTGVSASATDPDSPANALTYSLVTPPTGMTINPGTGAITWTPDESQGSNTFAIKIVVTDTNALAVNAKSISVTNTFNVTVNESNRPPVLTVPGNQIITEENALSVSASATDPDLPTNVLAFTLIAPPAGMTINTNTGAISWLPNESQGSNSYTVTVVVADTNSPAINAKFFRVTNTFNVTVNESNRPPVLTLPANQAISELVIFTNNATATDPDFPANSLTYALVSGPTGMVVTASGGISWTPSEFQGPTNSVVQIKVTDTNALAINATALSVTNSFTLTVNEVNLAPVVGTLLNQSGNAGQTVSFTATATDADLPTNTLSFSLVSPPSGASIGAGSGLFTWRLPAALGNTTNLVRVVVTDNGSPNRSGTNTFTFTVNPFGPVVLTPLGYSNGLFRLSVTGGLGPDYILQGSTTLTNLVDLATNTPVAMPFTFTNSSPFSNLFYRVRVMP